MHNIQKTNPGRKTGIVNQLTASVTRMIENRNKYKKALQDAQNNPAFDEEIRIHFKKQEDECDELIDELKGMRDDLGRKGAKV